MARPCVVGVDPGLTRCGVGVVAIDERQDLRPLAVDVIRTSAESEISLRLLAVSQGVGKILDRSSQQLSPLKGFSHSTIKALLRAPRWLPEWQR